MTSPPDLLAEAERHLRALAGPDAALREDQWRAIEALVVDRRRALVVQRTGWGKSAVYFVATALLREPRRRPDGDRLAAAGADAQPGRRRPRGPASAPARSTRPTSRSGTTIYGRGRTPATVDVLLVSPERLNNPDFRDERAAQARRRPTGLLVVDEAHCISDWGHDFRPDYRRLRTLLADLPAGIPVLATTATANARVTADVAEQLGAGPAATTALVLRGPLDRESLRLGVLQLPTAAHRLAWLADHLRELPGSGIIYTLTVAAAEEIAASCAAAGYDVAAYTGQTEDAERQAAEDDLLANRVKALVATSALGMGFDKPDLGFVVHLGAPPSPIAYYQQVGRAGPRRRARRRAAAARRARTRRSGATSPRSAFPPEDAGARARSTCSADAGRPLSTAGAGDAGRPAPHPAGDDAQGARRRRRGTPGAAAAGSPPAQPWAYDAERYARVAAARAAEQQAMRDYVAHRPAAGWSSCAGSSTTRRPPLRAVRQLRRPALLDRRVRARRSPRAQAHLGRPGVEIEPRRHVADRAGRARRRRCPGGSRADEQAAPGRALGRLSDLGWGAALRRVAARARRRAGAGRPVQRGRRGAAHLGLGAAAGRRRRGAVGARRPLLVDDARRAARHGRPAAAARRARPRRPRRPAASRGPTARSGSARCTARSPCHRSSRRRSRPGRPRRAARRRPGRLRLDDGAGRPRLRLAGAAAVLPFALALDG